MGNKSHPKAFRKASYMNKPCRLSKVKLQARAMPQALPLSSTTDPVIAKGPKVMPNSSTTPQKCHNATGLLADHAECSQRPRLYQALRKLAPFLSVMLSESNITLIFFFSASKVKYY